MTLLNCKGATFRRPTVLSLSFMALMACSSPDDLTETSYALTEASDTTQLANYGVYASGRLDLANSASIAAQLVGAKGIAWVEADSHVDGTIVSGTAIELRDRTTVTHGARSTGPINLGSNVIVTGLKVPNVPVPLPVSIPTHTVAAGSANYTVYAGTSRTLSPGSYGDITVYANGTLVLSGAATGASFTFRRLLFQPDAKLVLNTAGGGMSIDVATALSFGDRMTATLDGHADARQIQWYFNGISDTRIGSDVRPLYGVVTAPNALVELADRGELRGAIHAKTVRIGAQSTVTGTTDTNPCPPGHRPAGDLPGACVNYIEESFAGELIAPFVDQAGADKFYQTHADEYDFIVFFPATPLPHSQDALRSNSIQGINRAIYTSPTYPNLQSLINSDLYPQYQFSYRFSINTVHEIAHNWGIFFLGLYSDPTRPPPAHWPYHVDLFEGDTRYLDPLQYYDWVLNEGTEACVSQASISGWKFSKFSLYLMGLLPPEEAGVIKVHDFEPRPADDHYNIWGPACEEDHVFTGTRTITINDVIALNGPRVPSFATSPKDFKGAFIVVWPYGKAPDPAYLRYIYEEKQLTSDLWFNATGGRSHLLID